MDIVTLALAKKYADEKLTNIDGSSSTQSDWNQNDETAVDYIKNRPFYTADPVETYLVDESTLSTWYEYDDTAVETEVEYNDISEASTYAMAPSVLVLDQTYKVTWDGTEYDLVCFPDYDTGYYCLGGTVSNFEEYSFSIANKAKILYVYIPASEGTSASHTLKIAIETIEDIPIDEKYIPDTIARASQLEDLCQKGYVHQHQSTLTYNDFTYNSNVGRSYIYFLTTEGLWLVYFYQDPDKFTGYKSEFLVRYNSSSGAITSYRRTYNDDGSFAESTHNIIYATLYNIDTGKIITSRSVYGQSTLTIGEYKKIAGNIPIFVNGIQRILYQMHSFDDTLPAVTEEDNGKILQVVDGVWTAVEIANASEVKF